MIQDIFVQSKHNIEDKTGSIIIQCMESRDQLCVTSKLTKIDVNVQGFAKCLYR